MPKLSVVVPAFNEEDGIQVFLSELEASLEGLKYEVEVLIVNDGSTDRTRDKVLESNWEAVTIVNLVTNSGHMAALEAGLRMSSGDLVVTMDSDLQHPPRTVVEMIKLQERTQCDVVLAIRIRGDEASFLRRFYSRIFYRILSKITDVSVENDAGDFRLMTKRVVENVLKLPENQKIFRFLVGALGFRSEKISYHSPPRLHGSSKYQIKHLIRLATSSVIGFSTAPLTAIFVGGLVAFALSISYLLLILFNYQSTKGAQGWTSIMAAIVSLSSIQIISLGVIGRYLSQILTELRGRPNFIIDKLESVRNSDTNAS
jgi:dolichol-phosphate mannosyltransferase